MLPFEISLTRDTVTSIIACYLQSISAIPNGTDVVKIEYGQMSDKLPMKIHFKEEGLEIIHFDINATPESS